MFLDSGTEALTIEEAARRVGIGKSTMYRLLKSGKGPCVRKIGVRAVILADDFKTWCESLPVASFNE